LILFIHKYDRNFVQYDNMYKYLRLRNEKKEDKGKVENGGILPLH